VFEIEGYGTVDVDVDIAPIDATGDAGDDILSGDNGSNGLFGLAGSDTLDGRGGNDTLDGGEGDDNVTGGLGDDLFVFGDGDGKDTINDFEAGAASGDAIDLRRLSAFANFAGVMAVASQAGDDTVIEFSEDESLTLLGVDLTQLQEQDFIF
jgi:Ca2+-binding RTX toxin-like protein